MGAVCMRMSACALYVGEFVNGCDIMLKQRDLVNITWNVVDVKVKIWPRSANRKKYTSSTMCVTLLH